MLIRILVTCVLLFSILFMPLWVSVILALIGMFYLDVFWEAVALFLLSDILYGVPEAKFFGMIFVSFFAALITLGVVEFTKTKLKFYA